MTDLHLLVIIVTALFTKDLLGIAFKSIITNTFYRLDADRKQREFLDGQQVKKKPAPTAEGGTSIVTHRVTGNEL